MLKNDRTILYSLAMLAKLLSEGLFFFKSLTVYEYTGFITSLTALVFILIFKNSFIALAGVAQWIECQPENRKVTGWIPSRGTCLGCGPSPQ